MDTAKGVHSSRMPRKSVKNHSGNTRLQNYLNWGLSKGFKISNLPLIEQRLVVEVNERFAIHYNHRSLPINVGALSFAANNNYKQLKVINTMVFLTAG